MKHVVLTEPHQVTTRKHHRCAWCYESIPKGAINIWLRSYVGDDGPQTDWMHPECYEAMNQLDRIELSDGWMPGDFERGKVE